MPLTALPAQPTIGMKPATALNAEVTHFFAVTESMPSTPACSHTVGELI